MGVHEIGDSHRHTAADTCETVDEYPVLLLSSFICNKYILTLDLQEEKKKRLFHTIFLMILKFISGHSNEWKLEYRSIVLDTFFRLFVITIDMAYDLESRMYRLDATF